MHDAHRCGGRSSSLARVCSVCSFRGRKTSGAVALSGGGGGFVGNWECPLVKVIKRVNVCNSGDSGVSALTQERENAGFRGTVL